MNVITGAGREGGLDISLPWIFFKKSKYKETILAVPMDMTEIH
jgi:hypothetical protein